MPKAKSHKVHKSRKLNSNTQRNLFIAAIVLVSLGLLAFFMESKDANVTGNHQSQLAKGAGNLGPDHGCKWDASGYVCDIRIKNPSKSELEWSSILSDLDGATVSNNGAGTISPNDSVMVQLTVPEAFCQNDPDGKGTVTIIDSNKSTNQSQAEFDCRP